MGFEATRRTLPKLVAVLALTTIMTACSTRFGLQYPADFTYLTTGDVRNSMQAFALGISRLDTLLSEAETNPEKQQPAVVEELKRLERIADDLGAGPQRTNHLLIDAHIDRFKEDIVVARMEAAASPPSYYKTGLLIGGCTGCHVLR